MDLATYSKGNIGRHYMVADGFVNGPVVNRNGAMHMYIDRQTDTHTHTHTLQTRSTGRHRIQLLGRRKEERGSAQSCHAIRLKTAREKEFICEFATDVCCRSQPGDTTARQQQQYSMPVLTTRPRRRSTLVTGRLRAACPVTVPSRHYEQVCLPPRARSCGKSRNCCRSSRAHCSTYTRALAYRRRTPTGGDQCPTQPYTAQ